MLCSMGCCGWGWGREGNLVGVLAGRGDGKLFMRPYFGPFFKVVVGRVGGFKWDCGRRDGDMYHLKRERGRKMKVLGRGRGVFIFEKFFLFQPTSPHEFIITPPDFPKLTLNVFPLEFPSPYPIILYVTILLHHNARFWPIL